MPNQPPQPFGRVRLTQVVESWAAEQPLNPRLLARELADVLRTIGPGTYVLNHTAVRVTLYDPTTGAGGVTIEALADYFDRYSVGAPADTIETTNGATQAGAVLIARHWIGRLEIEAEARAKIAAGLQQVAPTPVATGGALPTEQHQPPLSGSAPECLELRQAQQRQDGEHSAGEQLEALRAHTQRLAAENNKLNAALMAQQLQGQQDRENLEKERRQANEDRRARQLAEGEVAENAQARAIAEEKLAQAEAALAQASDFAELQGALRKAEKWFKEAAPAKSTSEGRAAHLVVAGLLELLLDRARPNYNQGSAAKAIAQKGWRGAGERQVNGVFAEAKEAARAASSDAIAKAQDIQQSHAPSID